MLGIDKIVEHPYLVWDPKYPGIKSEIQPKLENIKLNNATKDVISIIDSILSQEQSKEEIFMKNLCDENSPLPPMIKNTLSSLWENNKSKFMTFYDAYEKQLIKDTATVKEALAAIKKYYEKFRFVNDKKLINDFFKTEYVLNVEETADDVFTQFKNYIANQEGYTNTDIAIIQKAIDVTKNEFYNTKDEMAAELKKGIKLKDLTVVKKNASTNSIKDALLNKLGGIFPGKTLEVARGGVVVGSQKIHGKNRETDSVIFFTAEFKRDSIHETDKALQESYEKMVEIEEKVIKEKGFIIHDSIKSGGGNLKIKGTGQYQQRLEEIKETFQKIGASFDSYKNFLFTFANTAQGFIAEGDWKTVQASLSQLAIVWMFDDMIPDLVNNIPATKALNFYNIRGYTISSSELLLLLKKKLENMDSKDKTVEKIKVLLSFTRASNANLTQDEKKSILAQEKENEMAAWETTYNIAMKRNQMGLTMNSTNLIKYLIES